MKNRFYKTATLVLCVLFLINLKAFTQERDLSKVRFGLQMQKNQNDLGFGLHVLSPTFLGNFRLKNSYNLSFITHQDNNGLSIWTPYSNLNFGTRYQTLTSNNINLYVEAGPQMLINPSSISSEKLNFGGYGLFGFEFFLDKELNRNTSYFIEIGASGNNSRADNVNTQLKIGSGFITSVGVRF